MISRTDTLIFMLALALVIGLYGKLWGGDSAAEARVVVWVSGEERLSLPLSEDRRIDVDGAIGRSVIEIRERRVRVLQSPGPRQLCVRAGWLEQAGDSAICLPNEVVVTIDAARPRFDAMSF
jgi:hypothetical protein